jgi:fatty acid desaturase
MSPETHSLSCDADCIGARTAGATPRHSTDLEAQSMATDIRELSQLSMQRSLRGLAFDWAVIGGCFALAVRVPHPAVWIGCAIVIAARQHGLLILMHDASHFRLLPDRTWNDRLSNWLCAWPLLVSTEGYRQNHLAHHFHLNSDDDPDWVRKSGRVEWKFPKTPREFWLLLLRDLCGGGFLDALRSIRDLSGRKLRAAERKPPAWQRLAYYGILATAISASGLLVPVLLLWFLPAFTVLTVILRVRSIAEHFGVEGAHDLNMSRNVHCRWWERFLLAPHNSGYHLDHHLYPSVPFYNLPRLHAALATLPAYAANSHQTTGFIGRSRSTFLNEITVRA